MLFNSLPFLFFFPLSTAAYFFCPHPWRWALLLAASCVFYMWFIPQYLLVLLFLIIVDYGMGILIEEARLKGIPARPYLIVSIWATCSAMVLFKYFNFFSTNLSALAGFLGLHYPPTIINLILPIGLSFHTLQSLSYVIEVYRGRVKAERHFGIYALYVMFYPQLVAGPIERPYNLIPQLRERHYVDYQRIVDALKLMAWGMFKKVVIADRLAVLNSQVLGDMHGYQGPELALLCVFSVIQFYGDFSGYSDIALGSAKAMGFKLTNNFNVPLFSRSMAEWWRRWNISFFSWLKDYVYLPLCKSRILRDNWPVNLMIAFLISGLWHGAGWTFIIWGAINGLYLVVGRLTFQFRKNIHRALRLDEDNIWLQLWQIAVTFTLFGLAGTFFKCPSVGDAVYLLTHLTRGWTLHFIRDAYFSLSFAPVWWMVTAVTLAGLFLMDILQKDADGRFVLAQYPVWVRWTYYYALVLAMVFWGEYGQNQFIYFQF